MPKAATKSVNVTHTSENELQEDSNFSHETSSEDEVVFQSPQIQPSTSQMHDVEQAYMSYIE